MYQHGEDVVTLHAAVASGNDINSNSLRDWVRGSAGPRFKKNYDLLAKIERHYCLPERYFMEKLFGEQCDLLNQAIEGVPDPHKRIIRWHVPQNFRYLPVPKQQEILEWIRRNALSCTTDFTKYLKWSTQISYGLYFPGVSPKRSDKSRRRNPDASPELTREVADYFAYRRSATPPKGYRRLQRWNEATADLKLRTFQNIFGALSASPQQPTAGRGLAPSQLCLGMLVFPEVWEWILSWRQARRGFLTAWEMNVLVDLSAMARRNTGWLRQNPSLADRIQAIPGLVTRDEVRQAQQNWHEACDNACIYAKDKFKEVSHLKRVHRDPFEPIAVILNSGSPLAEYRKIADEILKRLPDEQNFPLTVAEAMRSYLLLRLGMHLGVRQRNLRDLRLCARGAKPRTERQLEAAGFGEIRWDGERPGWEIVIPASAFKNRNSSFFQQGAYKLRLPNLSNLYRHIDAYIKRYRPLLLGGHPDPGTFFVRTTRSDNRSAAFTQAAIFELWRLTIQLYGIYNPYTKRGAIKGLLPHGPHCVRDVLATHVLKQTGSYALAAYAIQGTPQAVMKHYGRFLPVEKIALAANILNSVWQTPSRRSKSPKATFSLSFSDQPTSRRVQF